MGTRGDVLTRATTPRAAPPFTSGRRRRIAVVAAVAIAAASLGVGLASRQSARHDVLALPRSGDVPAAYHIVYRVTVDHVVTTEDLWVNRPFEAADVTYEGSTTTGEPVSTIVTRLGRQLLHDAGGAATVFEPPPAPSPFDVRLDAIAGIRTPALVPRGRMRVLGVPCQVYRTAQPLSAPGLSDLPTAQRHVDTCIDRRGLVLDERHTTDGNMTLARQAVTVTVGAEAIRHGYVTGGAHLPVQQGGGKVVTLTSTSRVPGQPSWELPQPPAGFTQLGRFAVVPPQPGVGPGQPPSNFVTAIDDVFVRGPDVIVLEQAQAAKPAKVAPDHGTDVDLGPLGHGDLTLSPLGSSLSAAAGSPNGFVDIFGTVPPAQLVAVARSLIQRPAGTLVTVPDITSDGP